MTKRRKKDLRPKSVTPIHKVTRKKSGFGGALMVKAGKTETVLQSSTNPNKVRRKREINHKISAATKKIPDITSSKSRPLLVHQEKIDFDNEYASLRERCHVRLLRKQTSRAVLSFQPASFQLDKPPLSPEALVDAAANLVADSFKDLGSPSFVPFSTSLSSVQVSGTIPSIVKMGNKKNDHEIKTQNYFQVLQNDDDSTDQEDNAKLTPLLSFAPPTFQFHPQSSVGSDVDPDL